MRRPPQSSPTNPSDATTEAGRNTGLKCPRDVSPMSPNTCHRCLRSKEPIRREGAGPVACHRRASISSKRAFQLFRFSCGLAMAQRGRELAPDEFHERVLFGSDLGEHDVIVAGLDVAVERLE